MKKDAPFKALSNTLTCIKAIYPKNYHEMEAQCALSIAHTPPIVTMSNLWIISTTTMQGSAMTVICPDKVTSSSLFQQPFHVLKLPLACSATSRYFHLPLHYDDHMMTIHISLNKANLNAMNISKPDFHIW